MWFNNLHIIEFEQKIEYKPEWVESELQHHLFKECSALHPITHGFVSPISGSVDDPLVYASQGLICFCLQTQQKLLPASVLREQHQAKIKTLEEKLGKKIGRDEKQRIKEELEHTLLSQAFSRSQKTYAYINTQTQRLLINSCSNTTLTVFYKFLSLIFGTYQPKPLTLQSPSSILTSWLRDQDNPSVFNILDHGSLENTNEQKGKARFSHIDLYDETIQSMLKENCRVTGLRLNWDDKICFNLKEDFSITSIKFLDEIKQLAKDQHTETDADRFATDLFIMTETISAFLADLLPHFIDTEAADQTTADKVAVTT